MQAWSLQTHSGRGNEGPRRGRLSRLRLLGAQSGAEFQLARASILSTVLKIIAFLLLVETKVLRWLRFWRRVTIQF
jgi:hypothetical protein